MAKAIITTQAQPATPAVGTAAIYVDSTSKKLSTIDDAGLVVEYGAASGATNTEIIAAVTDPASTDWHVLKHDFGNRGGVSGTATTSGDIGFDNYYTGTGGGRNYVAAPAGTYGVVEYVAGTPSGSYCGVETQSASQCQVGGGEMRFAMLFDIKAVPATPNDDYRFTMGFADNINNQGTDRAQLMIDLSVDATNWIAVTTDGTTTVTQVTTTAFATGWTWGEVWINADGSSIKYYVNGTLVHTETTVYPTGALQLECTKRVLDTSGSVNSRTLALDKAAYAYKPTAAIGTMATWLGTF